MQWYESNPGRWRREQEIAGDLLDGFEVGVDDSGRATISGNLRLLSEHGHLFDSVKLRFVYPPTFPERGQTPSVYLESHRDRWQKCGDAHIERDWKLCLFVPGECGIDFADSNALNDLLAVLRTYLMKQRIYQRRLMREQVTGESAHWPGEERSHGLAGIQEAIASMGGIGRNDSCPCGSGKKYKRCCMRGIGGK